MGPNDVNCKSYVLRLALVTCEATSMCQPGYRCVPVFTRGPHASAFSTPHDISVIPVVHRHSDLLEISAADIAIGFLVAVAVIANTIGVLPSLQPPYEPDKNSRHIAPSDSIVDLHSTKQLSDEAEKGLF